jgi:hypothetical protein
MYGKGMRPVRKPFHIRYGDIAYREEGAGVIKW